MNLSNFNYMTYINTPLIMLTLAHLSCDEQSNYLKIAHPWILFKAQIIIFIYETFLISENKFRLWAKIHIKISWLLSNCTTNVSLGTGFFMHYSFLSDMFVWLSKEHDELIYGHWKLRNALCNDFRCFIFLLIIKLVTDDSTM